MNDNTFGNMNVNNAARNVNVNNIVGNVNNSVGETHN